MSQRPQRRLAMISGATPRTLKSCHTPIDHRIANNRESPPKDRNHHNTHLSCAENEFGHTFRFSNGEGMQVPVQVECSVLVRSGGAVLRGARIACDRDLTL